MFQGHISDTTTFNFKSIAVEMTYRVTLIFAFLKVILSLSAIFNQDDPKSKC